MTEKTILGAPAFYCNSFKYFSLCSQLQKGIMHDYKGNQNKSISSVSVNVFSYEATTFYIQCFIYFKMLGLCYLNT